MKYSRILCIIRGDDSDQQTVETAVDLLTTRRRRLYLVYVISVPRTSAIDAHLPDEIRRAENGLSNAQSFARINPEDISSVILQGRTLGPIILREVFDRRISAVVTAIDPIHDLREYDIGADTLYLMEKSPSAVIAIRSPIEDWADDTGATTDSITYGTASRVG